MAGKPPAVFGSANYTRRNLDDLNRAMQHAYTTPGFAYDIGRPDQKVTHDLVSWQSTVRLPRDARLEVSYGFQHNNRREYDSRGFASTSPRPPSAPPDAAARVDSPGPE